MADTGFDLMPGEKMVLFSHPHWWYFWKEVLGGLTILVVFLLGLWAGGAIQTALTWVAVIGLVIWVIDLIYELIQWRTTKFAVTDQRVAYTSGFFRRKGVSIPLNRVNNVNFEQGVIARLTGNGVVTIESAGETGDSVFENIPDPDRVRNTIFDQIKAYEAADSERDAEALARVMRDDQPGGASPVSKSVQERLAELDQLRQTGAISDDEYATKREDILGSL